MEPDHPQSDDAFERLSCFLQILKVCGRQCSKTTTLLDFGCGSGYLVSAALKLGIDAYGCDVEFDHSTYDQHLLTDLLSVDRVRKIETIPSLESRKVFGLSPAESEPYHLPFDDCSFDLVISDQVLEHVDNYSKVAKELHRVMKPSAGFLHFFPSRFGLIERHTNIPLAGAFHPDWWVKLFAYAGVRIGHHDGLSASETFRWTSDYLAKHVNYLSQAQLIDVFSGLFNVSFVEREWLRINPRARLFLHPYLYRVFHSRCLYGVKL